jgi:hypothetical protein
MNHLLFNCIFARFVWLMVVCAFGFVRPPDSANDMLGGWIDSFPAPLRKSIFCGCTVVSWTIWKTRNDACFDRKFPDDPSSSIYRLCNILNYRAILQKNQDRGRLEDGAVLLRRVASEVYSRVYGWAPAMLRIVS